MKTLRLLSTLLSALAVELAVASAMPQNTAPKLLPIYEKVSHALATDNLQEARSAARALAAEASSANQSRIVATATSVGKATDLTAARKAFRGLSTSLIPEARHVPGYFILHCPMANADWIQSSRTASNPYLGAMMSSCGSVTEETHG